MDQFIDILKNTSLLLTAALIISACNFNQFKSQNSLFIVQSNCDSINANHDLLIAYNQNKRIIDSLLEELSKNDYIKSRFDTCNCILGITNAVKDYNAGELGYFFFGLPNHEFNTYVNILTEKYRIKVKGGGDVLFDCIGDCYNEYMDIKLKQRFGIDFYRKVQIECDSLYYFDLGDREALFPGGNNNFIRNFYSNFNLTKDEINNNKEGIFIRIMIDTNGLIKDVKFLGKDSCSDDLKDKIIESLKILPKWKPAIHHRKKIEMGLIIPIYLNPMKQKKLLENLG